MRTLIIILCLALLAAPVHAKVYGNKKVNDLTVYGDMTFGVDGTCDLPDDTVAVSDIDASGTNVFTELLRYTTGVTIVPLPSRVSGDSLSEEGRSHLDPASAYTVRLKATRAPTGARQRLEAADDCVPVLWVDGLWWGPIDGASDRGPNGRLFPVEIEAVELYNHPSILPAMFDSGTDAQNCGVVVVWKRGLVRR